MLHTVEHLTLTCRREEPDSQVLVTSESLIKSNPKIPVQVPEDLGVGDVNHK